MSEYLTTDEAAAVLGLKPRTVTRYCEIGLLACAKRGRDWQIARAEVDRFARERRTVGRPKEQTGE